MKAIDIIILIAVILFVVLVSVHTIRKKINNKKQGRINCSSGCTGCSGCDDKFTSFKEMIQQEEAKKNHQ